MVYQATISTNTKQDERFYIGMTKNLFKTRLANHTQSFNNPTKKENTALSKYYWSLVEKNKVPVVKWKILGQAQTCINIMSDCRLCLLEKLEIIRFEMPNQLLNQKTEIAARCIHRREFLLMNYENK